MSTINTLSTFYFGTTVTVSNQNMNFSENGVDELSAVLRVGNYSLTEYVTEIQRAFRIAGTQVYTATLNRTTRIITIAAPIAFELWTNTGTQAGTTAYVMAGFSTAADKTGAASYAGDVGAGSEYRCQHLLADYVSKEDSFVKESAAVQQSATGVTQLVHFGDGSRIRMNLNVITDIQNLKIDDFFQNVNGVANARTFMQYLITKAKVEFMPDIATRNIFVRVILESTPESSIGVQFQLKNMGFANFYETGPLVFREVITQ